MVSASAQVGLCGELVCSRLCLRSCHCAVGRQRSARLLAAQRARRLARRARVVNIRKEKADVYIGRGSLFGNQFVIGKHGNREQVIAKYRAQFYTRLSNDEAFKQQVLQLRGKSLGCYCKPKACHGDVIAEHLNGGRNG